MQPELAVILFNCAGHFLGVRSFKAIVPIQNQITNKIQNEETFNSLLYYFCQGYKFYRRFPKCKHDLILVNKKLEQ